MVVRLIARSSPGGLRAPVGERRERSHKLDMGDKAMDGVSAVGGSRCCLSLREAVGDDESLFLRHRISDDLTGSEKEEDMLRPAETLH